MTGGQFPANGPWWDAIRDRTGSPYQIRRLPGAGGPGCWRVQGPLGSVVLKPDVPRRERLFYEHFAPRLADKGLATPRLHASGTAPDWIVLEWVERSLSYSAWGRDSGVFAYLATWHEAGREIMGRFDESFRFRGPGLNQEAVVSLLPKVPAGQILHLIHESLEQFHGLLEPVSWVHGDTNPTNWLVASDGTRVLTDWSRYGQAHPAMDVAIFLPALPTPSQIRDAAQRYARVQNSPGKKPKIQELCRNIAFAKLWSVIDFLGMVWRGEVTEATQPALIMLQASLEQWVPAVFSL